MTAGTHSVQFDGNGFATGVYFARLQTEANTTVTKLVIAKIIQRRFSRTKKAHSIEWAF
jgi:hypothetical protein